jgi:hypothetical protein
MNKKRARCEPEEKEEKEQRDWSDASVGYLERGVTIGYESLDAPSEQTSQTNWGCLWITDVDVRNVITLVQMHGENFTVVDIVNEKTTCIKFETNGPPLVLNRGPTPCVYSQTERKPPPQGYWYHFIDQKWRTFVHAEIDRLYEFFGDGACIYLVLAIHPLKLIKVMDPKEASAFFANE